MLKIIKRFADFLILLWIFNLPFILVLLCNYKDKHLFQAEIICISLSSSLFMICYLTYKRFILQNHRKGTVLLSITNMLHLLLLFVYVYFASVKTSLLFIATVIYLTLPLCINLIEIIYNCL
jgi:hypothetical protein